MVNTIMIINNNNRGHLYGHNGKRLVPTNHLIRTTVKMETTSLGATAFLDKPTDGFHTYLDPTLYFWDRY